MFVSLFLVSPARTQGESFMFRIPAAIQCRPNTVILVSTLIYVN